jgi:hypothetical protein
MGAELSPLVSVAIKRRTTVGADECIDSLAADMLGVIFPPSEATGIRAEASFFSARMLRNGLAAILANSKVWLGQNCATPETVTLADGFYGVCGCAKGGCYLCVTQPVRSHP